ncbi:Txe/YoeB family addiction module toxin [Candidatus Rariloculus sp.]|uniref:Txe/YoeB family addiction module toxin n=1 Tax=Candidatus Rariloculus sp. TaxID=3101265 RepID=UPI003D0C76E4
MTGEPRKAVMDPHFLEDLEYWTRTDRRRALRTLRLVEATLRNPFAGPGKPEPLRGQLSGKWSRRIDQEHRLVYQVDADKVYFLAARFHY